MSVKGGGPPQSVNSNFEYFFKMYSHKNDLNHYWYLFIVIFSICGHLSAYFGTPFSNVSSWKIETLGQGG